MGQSNVTAIITFTLITLLGTALSMQVYQQAQTVNSNNSELLHQQLPLLQNVSKLAQGLTEHERILYEYYATENRRVLNKSLSDNYAIIEYALSELENHSLPESTQESIEKLYIQQQQIARSLESALENGSGSERWDEARALLNELTANTRQITPLLSELISDIKNQVSISQSKSSNQLNNMITLVSSFTVVILAIAIFGGLLVRTRLHEAKEKKRLETLIERSPNPLSSLAWDGSIRYKNPAWLSLETQMQSEISLETITPVIEKLLNGPRTQHSWQINSHEKIFLATLYKHQDLKLFIWYLEDITQRRKAEKELEYLAFNDPLTGLNNRRKMELDADYWIEQNPDCYLGIVVIGIDRFSQVTASHGFKVGDQIILSIKDRVQQCLEQLQDDSPDVSIYRFNGAKFILLIKGDNKINIRAWTNKITDDIQNTMLNFIANTHGHFYLHLSFGASYFPQHGERFSSLLQNADTAYSLARRNGGSQLIEFDNEMAETEKRWLDMEVDMRVAQNKQQFYLMYQPKVASQNGALRGVEALVRWQHPEKGFISPAEFIPIAEQSGLIIEIGEWILLQACRQTKQWHEQGIKDLVCAVNISPLQFLHIGFLDTVEKVLQQTGLDPHFLELEITEGVLMHEVSKSTEILEQLHNKGLKVSIDDFGTGYSSLSYLKTFPLDKLKIDKSFVDNITSDDADRSIIKTIIDLAKHLNLIVIAEGVEHQSQLAQLIEYGCDEIQGYYFSKPIMPDELNTFINQQKKSIASLVNNQ